jgi:acetyl-CoA C-acetyltransferase
MNGTNEVVLAGAVRTAIGTFGGAFVDTPATQLGATVIAEALRRPALSPADRRVIFGNVLSRNRHEPVPRPPPPGSRTMFQRRP